ncbi:GtrA family protein [Liquorilactobacillus cacaonum]|uniref:GtcA family membrane protein n=1 Tax=Liquorilactobacillus cacaonum DSM 21116 TaxID=1423729 RepID=A0A0R2CUY4_9LACO|nr:GtrA family protein [Liquorilactobacillus cacaonum]KRM91929.1 GtcA family membrane protein [Liquorilactobacillus cacaonum DSM 21116]
MNNLVTLFEKYKQVIAYLFWGGATTVINIGIFEIWNMQGLNYQVGNVLAWFVSVLVAYISNKLWVFKTPLGNFNEALKESSSFFFYRSLTLLMDIVITWIGISILGWNSLIVKIIDNVIVILANYFFSKWYIFKKTIH